MSALLGLLVGEDGLHHGVGQRRLALRSEVGGVEVKRVVVVLIVLVKVLQQVSQLH